LLAQHAEVLAAAWVQLVLAFLPAQSAGLQSDLSEQQAGVSITPGLAVLAFWLQPAKRAATLRAVVTAKSFIGIIS
tara:strand:- start:385 stop:612 length:228 start_codon:yes stop_codon:yes gene_type:complete